MIRLAADNSPVDIAWGAFDAAAIDLNRMYREVDPATDTAADRARRMKAGKEVLLLWNAWRALFLADDQPRPAA